MSLSRYEILAPAGDHDCLLAAVGAGADAVYLGLDVGFNARAKAAGFSLTDLPKVLDSLHARGVSGYITLNTLVTDVELPRIADLLGAICGARADAIIVQDLAVASLAHAVVPDLPIHASTQMTVTTPEAAGLVAALGVRRITLPRELGINHIRRFRQQTQLGLECFVHGALCISYSGQCLASAAGGQGSANRGLCAQPCRLVYDRVVDGRVVASPRHRYPLSPKDLAAHRLMAVLVDAGVESFKIEGRYKSPEYVAGAVECYRRALDAVVGDGAGSPPVPDDDSLVYTFSRGFCTGWLEGDDHQALSHGVYPGHRGRLVGEVVEVRGYRVYVRVVADAPRLKPGDWMVFAQGDAEDDEPKGGIFALGEPHAGVLEVRFGDPGPDLRRVHPGAELWKSHDSAVKKRLLRYRQIERRVDLDVAITGAINTPLRVQATDALGRQVEVSGPILEAARNQPLDEQILKDKLVSFGDTMWQLRALHVELQGAVAASPKALKALRRELVAKLMATAIAEKPRRHIAVSHHTLWPMASSSNVTPAPDESCRVAPQLVVLCRSLAQVDVAVAQGAHEIYLDLSESSATPKAIARCRDAGVRVLLAGARIERPGETDDDDRLLALGVDGLLLRHLGALARYRRRRSTTFSLHGDFSLNCANAVTARFMLCSGLTSVVPAADLTVEQLTTFIGAIGGRHVEIVLHQHVPMYHTQHCLYARNLSTGHNRQDCGQPCLSHQVSLRDVRGRALTVLVDAHCRNTVYSAEARSLARHLPAMLAMGVRRFRIELLRESATVVAHILEQYHKLLRRDGNAAW